MSRDAGGFGPAQGIRFPNDTPAAGFRHWNDARATQATNTRSLPVRFGRERMVVTLRAPGVFRLTHGRTPDVPPRRRDSLYLELTGTNATFTTTLEPAR